MNTASEALICVASFIAAPGSEEALKTALYALIEPTRREPGCVHYDLHQSLENPALLTMIEHFQTPTAFAEHSQQPYLLAFKEQLPLLATSVSVQTYRKI